MANTIAQSETDCTTLIPAPIVRLNRLTILFGVILAFVLHAPLITTVLFLVVALAATFGRRASIIYFIGRTVLRPSHQTVDGEDPRLMRFNNILAAIILGLAALAAAIALAGFCFGCFLFYQFKLKRARLFGTPMR